MLQHKHKRELNKLDKLLEHIDNSYGSNVVIPLKGGAFYLSIVDNKLHPLKASTPMEIVVDVYCDTIMFEDTKETIKLDTVVNLRDN